MTERVRLVLNAAAASRCEYYGAERAAVLGPHGFAAAGREIASWPRYQPTPLATLPGLAHHLGLGLVWYKDEGHRFEVKSFKALGGPYAIRRMLDRLGRPPRDVTVTCATDGNHGRAVAWAARRLGCRCVIFIHASVSPGREVAIRELGAEVVRLPGTYDDAVRQADAEAVRQGWTVISDTATAMPSEAPIDIMHGYGLIATEICGQLPAGEVPTHVFVQVGVGGLAAALCAQFWLAFAARRPTFVTVEPFAAASLLMSLEEGRLNAATGDLGTVMAGLACGELSPPAWRILRMGADGAIAIDDDYAIGAMRCLASPRAGDPPIIAGETGGAGLGALLALRSRPDLAARLGLDRQARVLLIGTEGDTDPELYGRMIRDEHDGGATPDPQAGPDRAEGCLKGEVPR